MHAHTPRLRALHLACATVYTPASAPTPPPARPLWRPVPSPQSLPTLTLSHAHFFAPRPRVRSTYRGPLRRQPAAAPSSARPKLSGRATQRQALVISDHTPSCLQHPFSSKCDQNTPISQRAEAPPLPRCCLLYCTARGVFSHPYAATCSKPSNQVCMCKKSKLQVSAAKKKCCSKEIACVCVSPQTNGVRGWRGRSCRSVLG